MAKITSKLILAFLLLFIMATAEIAAAQQQRYCPVKPKIPCNKCDIYCKRIEMKHHGRCLGSGAMRSCYCYKPCTACDDLEDSEVVEESEVY